MTIGLGRVVGACVVVVTGYWPNVPKRAMDIESEESQHPSRPPPRPQDARSNGPT